MIRKSGMIFALTAVLAACAHRPSFEDNVYRDGRVAYRVGPLGEGWERVGIEDGQLAFRHAQGGGILAQATCDGMDDVSLDVLTNHLLFGVEERKELARQTLTLDGRAALRTQVSGMVDGVPVLLDLVVLKKDGCTYDMHLVAGDRDFPLRRPDFERFVAGFARVRAP
ncbi:MAG: hypothetical protein GMKNLPBB_00893 [Myxococcota bacterium]|nr:hypothetical protein [Myxococcota bacterium]